MNKQKTQMSKKKRNKKIHIKQFSKKERNNKNKPKSDISSKKQNHYFSTKTGTQSRKHKKEHINIISDKDYLKNKIKKKQMKDSAFPFIDYLIKDTNETKIKLTEKDLLNLMRKDLEEGYSYNEKYKRVIERGKNDDIILELNSENILKQKIRVRVLALSLLRTKLSRDINAIIISYGLNGIYLEPNIYKLLPDLVLKTIYEIEEKLHNRFGKIEVFKEYQETKPYFYKLVEKMFYRRYFNISYFEIIYQHIDNEYWNGINNFQINFNIPTY